jgi:hypothetical protein
MVNKAVVFGAYLPATYYISRHVRPLTVGVWTVAWWYGYKNFTVPFHTGRFQSALNQAAKPIAGKYVKE